MVQHFSRVMAINILHFLSEPPEILTCDAISKMTPDEHRLSNV